MLRAISLVLLLVPALFGMLGCAASEQVRRGDELCAAGRYEEALLAYEEALEQRPKDPTATARMREARRLAVRAVIDHADAALATGDFVTASREALKARRLPLDLDAVELARRIDATVARAAELSEARVSELEGRGHFLTAVELANEFAQAAPSPARAQWAAELRARAVAHYLARASELSGGLPGAAALTLAVAKALGSDVPASSIAALWARFAGEVCFARPSLRLQGGESAPRELTLRLERQARAELEALCSQCGVGHRPLDLVLALTDVSVIDQSSGERVQKPLPGVTVATEEVFYEDEPYSEVEEVVEQETRRVQVERRDCAPRPGKQRGCVTWTEEGTETVPVTKQRVVQKTRRVEKRRALPVSLPPDKAVTYEVTRVTRHVRLNGEVRVTGAQVFSWPFHISADSEDVGHPEVRNPKLTIPADPLEALPLATLWDQAAARLQEAVRTAFAAASKSLGRDYEERAQRDSLAGHLPEAEESYLALVALGRAEQQGLGEFFLSRYGVAVQDLMQLLARASGRAVDPEPPVAPARAAALPARQTADEAAPDVEAQKTGSGAPAVGAPAPMRPSRRRPASTLTEEELRSLQEESLRAAQPNVSEPQEQSAPPAGSAEVRAGEREPVKPN